MDTAERGAGQREGAGMRAEVETCGVKGCYRPVGTHNKATEGTREYVNEAVFPLGVVRTCNAHWDETLWQQRMITSGQDIGG